MDTARSISLFLLAALAEIGGAWLIWHGLREHKGLLWIAAGGSQRNLVAPTQAAM